MFTQDTAPLILKAIGRSVSECSAILAIMQNIGMIARSLLGAAKH
jgi:hypothetical protein